MSGYDRPASALRRERYVTRFPNLFIIGAPKSGTTSLYEWLRGHPDVFMSSVKEPGYYARDLAADRSGSFLRYGVDRERYLALFGKAGDVPRVGEASTRYLYSKDAAALIARDQSDARIIAILRNPVDMIVSLHAHKVAGGTEDLADLEAALAAEDDRHAGRRLPPHSNPYLATYRDRVRYGEQLARWMAVFGPEHVKVLIFEEMIRHPATHYRSVLEAIGADPGYQPASFAAFNPAHEGAGGFVRSMARTRPVQFAAWRVLPRVIGDERTRAVARRVGHDLLRRPTTSRTVVSDALRRRLQAELAPDIAHLSELLGRDMSALWFAPAATGASTDDSRVAAP